MTLSKFLKVAFTMIIWAALCILCLQHEKLVVIKSCSFLPPSTATCSTGWCIFLMCVHALLDGAEEESEGSVCNSLLALVPSLPSTDTLGWGIGKEAVQLGLLSLLLPLDGHTHWMNAELGGWCCVLYAFWLISIIHYMLCVSQPWLLTL